ncbi:MAG: NUDIX domain-containing protein, partial [Bacteroidales bacterium]|nr:NUDIX domain-containing protein [Bacteroidales bacterium]
MEVTRHFTATTIVVYNNKALLHMHKKLGFWLPVGGHIDRDELPHVAALREAKEESGLDVELFNDEE